MVLFSHSFFYTTELAFDAILGNSSAHSLAIGPVIVDPFIYPFGFTMTPALSFKPLILITPPYWIQYAIYLYYNSN